MSCEICLADTTDDQVLLTCIGCTRTFHAACAGVTVQRGSLRKKEKRVDPLKYIIPCCTSCQSLITLNFQINSLTAQQAQLAENINNHTDFIHRLNQQVNVELIHEAFDRLELLLADIKKELMVSKNSGLAGGIVAIKNHITSALDTAMQETNKNMSATLSSMKSDVSNGIKCLNAEVDHLSTLTIEMADRASSVPAYTGPILELDILDELKAISANIMTAHAAASSTPSLESCPSLEIEMSEHTNRNVSMPVIDESESQPKAACALVTSGWRMLGTKRLWKADWSQYDARKSTRDKQQKMADKAKAKRKKQIKARAKKSIKNSNNANCSQNSTNNTRHISNDNYPHNNNNFDNAPRRTVFDRCNKNPRSTNYLPPDRVLLATAKSQFSHPPLNYRPTIQFEKRETLNPYPDGPTSSNYTMIQRNLPTPCEACTCRHSCFRRN